MLRYIIAGVIISFYHSFGSELALHQTVVGSLVQGDGCSDSSSLPCHSFSSGRSTNQNKNNYFLSVLCALSNDPELGRGKATNGSG
jgi:hypothetical protein